MHSRRATCSTKKRRGAGGFVSSSGGGVCCLGLFSVSGSYSGFLLVVLPVMAVPVPSMLPVAVLLPVSSAVVVAVVLPFLALFPAAFTLPVSSWPACLLSVSGCRDLSI